MPSMPMNVVMLAGNRSGADGLRGHQAYRRYWIDLVIAMVQLGGLEPPTSCSTDRRSNQLSYNCILCEAPQRGSSNSAETRCNAPLWQGRNDATSMSSGRRPGPKNHRRLWV